MSLILYKTFRPVLLILVVLLLGCMFTDLCPAEAKKPVTHEQTKAQVELFRDALDNFGASSPKQVINIWVKAVKTRNGALHYAAASREFKEKLIAEWSRPEESCWVTGTSSPWLDKYKIVYSKKLNDSEYEARLRYYWRTSAGPAEPTETVLRIIRQKDFWYVKDVK